MFRGERNEENKSLISSYKKTKMYLRFPAVSAHPEHDKEKQKVRFIITETCPLLC